MLTTSPDHSGDALVSLFRVVVALSPVCRLRATVRHGSPGKVGDIFAARFTVLRLFKPLKMFYEAEKKRAEPYNRIVEELPEMRRDTVELVKKAVREKRRVYVLVNNRSEGNALLTIQALQNALQAAET